MNDFDGLLPRRIPGRHLPDRGGPGAIVYAARLRRRRQATRIAGAGSAASLTIAGLALAHPNGGRRGLAPAVPPGVSASATVTVPPSLDPDHPLPPLFGSPTPSATATSTPEPDPVDESPTPDAQQPSDAPVRYVTYERATVDDSTATCRVYQSESGSGPVLCGRYTGPTEARSGVATDLSYELCAPVADVVLHYKDGVQELSISLEAADASHFWFGAEDPAGLVAHDVTVPHGKCLRWTAHWDGFDNAGTPMPPDTYPVAGFPGNGEWQPQEQGIDSPNTAIRITE